MGIAVKGKKKKKKAASVDCRAMAREVIESSGFGILSASRNTISDKKSVRGIVRRADSSARSLRGALENDTAIEAEDPELFGKINEAISSFEGISSEVTEALDSFPGPPSYRKDAFEEVVSDGTLCLGNTGFVLPKDSIMMIPNKSLGISGDTRVITDEHRDAGARVKAIVSKHISEEG